MSPDRLRLHRELRGATQVTIQFGAQVETRMEILYGVRAVTSRGLKPDMGVEAA